MVFAYEVSITDNSDNKTNLIKTFDTPIEVNEYMGDLRCQKEIGSIKDYSVSKISNYDLSNINTDLLLKRMPFESFIKIVKDSIKEPTIKTF